MSVAMDQYSNDPYDTSSAEDLAAHRAGARDSMLLTAMLSVRGLAPVQVRVRNLSSGGLMAEHDVSAAIGDPATVEIRGLGLVQGHVAWAVDGRLGIAFTVEVDPRKARKPVASPTPRPAAPSKRTVI